MRRNTNGREYAPLVAQTQAQKRREGVSGNAKVLTPELKALVIKLLKQDFSPVQIHGRLRKTGEGAVSHETLYRIIGTYKKQGSPLYTPMRHHRKTIS